MYKPLPECTTLRMSRGRAAHAERLTFSWNVLGQEWQIAFMSCHLLYIYWQWLPGVLCQGRFRGCSPSQQERVLWSLLMWVRRVKALEPSTGHCWFKESIGGIFIPTDITVHAPEVGSGNLKLEKHQTRLGHKAKILDCAPPKSADFFYKQQNFF